MSAPSPCRCPDQSGPLPLSEDEWAALLADEDEWEKFLAEELARGRR